MTGSFDVAIIGAGPGGSTLAALLASRGVRVALIDRDTFPRDKLCGEFLSYDALPIVELLGVNLGDARRLPFRDNSVDVITAAHFIHHFAPEDAAALLREWLRVARRGVIVNDTLRHYIPLAMVLLLSKLRLFGRITRFDAPASVRRGYTVAEATAFAQDAGAARAEVVRAWPFRFGILLWK